ncbi:MAG TPA: hypothetical protein VJZ76_21250 [Thermoanaerobaculia bacterium]|jgi:uncharacterized membrane protein|nr:hypothetical protein [Thermoanaerobaculia bacterium]
MKRIALIAVLLVVSLAAYGATKLTIEPSQMKDGETKTLVDGDKTITVHKSGDNLDIKIEGAGKTRTITLNNTGGDIHIFRDGTAWKTIPDGTAWKTIPMPEGRVLLDQHFEHLLPKAQTWFVCPKDHTMLRVPEDKADQTFKCPIDGTTLEKKKGRGMALFFDHGGDDM